MAAAAEPLMDRAAMKRLLTRSKEELVHCAVGMGPDPQVGLLLLDKIKQPKALERDVLKIHPDTRNPRFGRAEVDAAIDAKLVRFHLNKPAPGIARRLVKTLKGTGFNKVEIVIDDGVVESAGEPDEEEQAAAPGSPPELQQVQPPADAAAVRLTVMDLIKRVQAGGADAGADAAARATLIKLAGDAAACLKAGNLAGAGKAAEALRQALDGAPGTNAAGPSDAAPPAAIARAEAERPSPVKMAKAALLWRGMWAKADKDLQALHEAVVAAMYDDEEVDSDDYGTIEDNLRQVTGITTRLNVSLADELDALQNASPGALKQVARRLDEYASYLESDELVGMLADNEFHPVSVKADLLKAVQTIKSAMASA